jgi:hypothetical protein
MYKGEIEVNTPENEAARIECAKEIRALRTTKELPVFDRLSVSDFCVFAYGFEKLPLNFLAFYLKTLREVVEEKKNP